MWVMTRKGPKYQKVAPCDLWKRVTGSVFFSENEILIFKKAGKIQKKW